MADEQQPAQLPGAAVTPAALREGVDSLPEVPADFLGPKFQVLGVLGAGAVGTVLRARHCELDKIVAVKVLNTRLLDREKVLRFRREARVANDLVHPNIVRVQDFDRAPDGSPFLVMEYLEGIDLEGLLKQEPSGLPLERVVELSFGVADALDRAHAAGVIHRDLKPANLFLTQEGRLKILDFGICHWGGQDEHLTETGKFLGTPLYMAPEQIRGEPPVPGSDIFSLAAILFQLLTGQPPFSAKTLSDLVQRSLDPHPPRAEQLAPRLAPGVGDMLERAMSAAPASRFASAKELVMALAQAGGISQAVLTLPTPGLHSNPNGYPLPLLSWGSLPNPPVHGPPPVPQLSWSVTPSLGDSQRPTPGPVAAGPSLADSWRPATGSPSLADSWRRTPGPPAISSASLAPPAPPPASPTWPTNDLPVTRPLKWGKKLKAKRKAKTRLLLLIFVGLAVLGLVAVLLYLFFGQPKEIQPTAQRWPDQPRLLVLPFQPLAADRDADLILWPLVDRMVINALEPEDRLLGRLSRIDPLAVEEQIRRRDLGSHLSAERALELGQVLGSNLILRGTVGRREGLIHLEGELSTPSGDIHRQLRADSLNLVDAATSLAAEIRQTLGFTAPPLSLPPAAPKLLALEQTATLLRLAALPPSLSNAERTHQLEQLLTGDPSALGVSWILYLENSSKLGAAEELIRRVSSAGGTSHPEFRRFLLEIAQEDERPNACDGLDLAALEQRYPRLLGPLARSMCLYRKGDLLQAEFAAREAFDDLALRPLARVHYSRLVALNRACDEQLLLGQKIQRLLPEKAIGWSVLANWYARCDRQEQAARYMKVAHSLLGSDRQQDYWAAVNGALVAMVGLDLEEARHWFDVLEQYRPEGRWTSQEYLVRSFALAMAGKYREAQELAQQGMEDAAHQLPDSLSDQEVALGSAAFFLMLSEGRPEEAEQLVQRLAARNLTVSDIARYDLDMLRLALQCHRQLIEPAQLPARMAALAAGLTNLGERGQQERSFMECQLLSRWGTVVQNQQHLAGVTPAGSNDMLGGCRFRHAQGLQEQGKLPEAAQQYQLAIKEIIYTIHAYADLLPVALLSYAQLLQQQGHLTAARLIYQRIADNYRKAERELGQTQAAAALAKLR